MKKENEIVESLKGFLKENLIKVTIQRERRIFAHIKSDALRDFISYLVRKLDVKHLSTITAIDLDGEIELIYHLTYKGSTTISIRITLSKKDLKASTITDLIPGAVLYEREVHDLFGIEFEGHPDLSRLMLPEEWPEDVYPMRKEYGIEQLREMVSKKQS